MRTVQKIRWGRVKIPVQGAAGDNRAIDAIPGPGDVSDPVAVLVNEPSLQVVGLQPPAVLGSGVRAFPATIATKVDLWRLRKFTMYRADDLHLGPRSGVAGLVILVEVAVDRSGLGKKIGECLPQTVGLFRLAALPAALASEVVRRQDGKQAMGWADQLDRRGAADVSNGGIVVAVAVFDGGVCNELSLGFRPPQRRFPSTDESASLPP